MGVPLQVEDLLFNIDRKKQRKRGCFACGEKDHFKDNCPNMAKPKKGRSKGKDTHPPILITLITVITQMPYGKR
jgi:hypothetical protein